MSALAEGVPSTLVLWRKVRQLLPVYAAIADSCRFTPPPCGDLSAFDACNDEVLGVAAWIEEIDSVSQPHHLRTVLQELDICSSDMCVSTWLQHFIAKPVRGTADRDKIDFLLSHYLRMNLPPSLQEGKPNYAAMKAVLEPVLGSCDGDLPEEAREVEELIGIAERCRTLAEFERSGIIRRGRELKQRAGEQYFTPGFLVAFTHFNAVVRRECHRLMNSDLKFIGEALDRLEQQGISHIDCTAANWSAHEPVSELQNKWATWELANNDYSQDFFANLIAFRSSVEEALERCIELSMTSVSQELRTIHALLLEMRSQIDELPRKFGQVARPNTTEESVPVPAKPVLVWQSSAKATHSPATEIRTAGVPSQPKDLPPGDSPLQPNRNNGARECDSIARSEAPLAEMPVLAPDTEATLAMQALDAIAPPMPTPAVTPDASPVISTAAIPVTATARKETPAPAVVNAPSQGQSEIKEAAQIEAAPPATMPPTNDRPVEQRAEAVPNVAPATTAPAVPVNAATAAIDLEAGIARLQKNLSGKRPSAVSIAVAGTRILLTAAEASMFSLANNRYAQGVQRAVMMRICLVSALETHSKTRDKAAVAPLVPVGRAEQATVRELIAECKAQKLAREEEILSATAKQLSAMLERAERIAR